MLCLTRLTAFFERHNEALRALYRFVGEMDACIAIANFRASGVQTCEPEFTGDRCVAAEGLAHPLLQNPVRYDIVWDRCALVTGSNASGKSTFTKALAINAILAQSVYTCTARKFAMPFARVLSSMALRDDVEGGESYFIVEIKSLRRIISTLDDGMPTLCFIDEILRGTNTAERIAASSALLAYLESQNCLCMAATHDQELTKMLPQYRQLHFREDLTPEGMTFSYKLLEGPSDTRNAIALLKQMDFPEAILDGASAAVQRYEKKGSWQEKDEGNAP
jgi:DNA mismatch repair ATPase MutS